MNPLSNGEKTHSAEARRMGRGFGRRICALVLILGLLLESSGVVPNFMLSPFVLKADAADTFTYQPKSFGVSVLPKEEVFSLSKLRELEDGNPTVVLNINHLFSRQKANNILSNNPKIGDLLTGVGSWSANYQWNPNNTAAVKNHLLNQAMDLEVLWTGSYMRSNSGNPSAQVWYYGNEDYLLIYARNYDTLSIGRGTFVEIQGGEFSSSASGTVKSGSTDAVPLAYNRIAKKSRWSCRYDSKGRIIYDQNGHAVMDEHPYTEYYPTVAGEHLKVKPVMGPPNGTSANGIKYYSYEWLDTVLNVTLSGTVGTSISDTKVRLRDNAAPFLNKITLRKNNGEVSGNVYMKSTDTLDIVMEFNEDIRFADNMGNDHNLKLRLSFVDSSNGTSDSDSWIEADLISLAGQTMTFRFDKNSASGKPLPDEFYIDGISAAAQTGWYSSTEDFPLSLIDASGNSIVTGSSCCGVVTDLAGNPFEKFNVTRFEDSARAYFDNTDPYLYKTSIWTENLSQAEASSGNNINETDPDKLFLKVGDKVYLKSIFSEELNTTYTWVEGTQLKDKSGNSLTPTATLNVKENGQNVTLALKSIGTVDSKSIDVNAASRLLTVIEYQPLTVTVDMVVDGDYIKIIGIDDLTSMCDRSLNDLKNPAIPLPPYQQRIDVTPPVITVGATVDDSLDPDVFTVPIQISDAESGFAGKDFQFRLANGNTSSDYLWMVDNHDVVVKRESDQKTADTTGWTAASAKTGGDWISVTPPIGASQMYLHVKIMNPESWDYELSQIQGETEGTRRTTVSGSVEVKAADIKANESAGSISFNHAIGQKIESVITFGGVTYDSGKAIIPVTVTNPLGVQKIVWGTSEDAMIHEAYEAYSTGTLIQSYTFGTEIQITNAGTVILYVGAYGPDGTASINSVSYDYDFSAGVMTYQKMLGEEKAPLFGLPVINDVAVTEDDRTMVLIDRGDGSFFAATDITAGTTNLFDENSGLAWYTLTGSAAADYSSLTVTASSTSSAAEVAAWLGDRYGKVTFVLLNQDPQIVNGEGGWDTVPGSYDATDTEKAIAYAVEYAYLANDVTFTVTSGVVYSESGSVVPSLVLVGDPENPHSDLSDYTFTAELANNNDAGSNQSYGLRIVQSAEAELFYSADGTNYESVRVVELSVGSTTKLCFTKADGERSGWYKVEYRYTVNGTVIPTTLAEGVYLDNTAAITPDVVSYNRSFDLYVREPMWKYAAYFIVDYSYYSHNSVASVDNIEDGDIVKIGVAPIEVPEDKMANGARLNEPLSCPSALNRDEQYLDRYYLADNEVNALTFTFTQTNPDAGSADISRIGGTNHFYAWSGNDPHGRENARANWMTFTVGKDITLTATDGTNGFTYSGVSLPLTDGYNLVHYVVEYANGETVEKSFMADVRTKAMNLGLDVYYHAADQYISDEQLAETWAVYQTLEDEDGNKLYPTQQDYLDSIGAVKTNNTGVAGNDTPSYVVVGAKCTDEADLYHRNEAVVNPVLNDYDTALASSFTSYRHLDGEYTERTVPADPKSNPMGEERFRKSSEHELFFAEDVYGNVSFAALEMDAIDGEAPELSFASCFAKFNLGDITRDAAGGVAGFDFMLDLKDDHPLDLSSLSVSFDPAYSQVLDPTLDGVNEQLTMDLPLNFAQDDLGYFLPWEISESEAGKTGGITMTCLKMDLGANPDSPEYKTINGVEIQGAFKPCQMENDKIVMTFQLTDTYGNVGSAEIEFSNEENSWFKLNSESYALHAGINDNYGWYEGYTERDADRHPVNVIYPGIAELPDWAPEPQYYTGSNGEWEGINVQLDYDWKLSVTDLLPELDPYGAGTYFTNEGYVKVGVSLASQKTGELFDSLPYALSVESYATDHGVFTDGYVRTRTYEKMTGRYEQGSYYQTEQAIILPSVTENGSVTVNWTDVFGEKHTDEVVITAFGKTSSNDRMGVRASFSPATRTNEDVLVTLKGDRTKEGDSTTTCVITGVTVNLRDGTSFDETDPRVSIYASQPWNATVRMTDNGTITVSYRFPYEGYDDVTATQGEYGHYSDRSAGICVATIDKTPPVPTVSYVYADTGEAVPDSVTATTRPIRADVTAEELIEGVEGGLSCTFPYGTAKGAAQTITIRDLAGNTVNVTATCPATISEPAPSGEENNPPTATVYLAANLGGVSKNLGTFTLAQNGETTVTAEDGTTQTVNLNAETVAAINAAIAADPATLYTLRFEINDESPAACTLTSSDPAVAAVGANNTVAVRTNGSFNLTVSDSGNNTSSLTGIVVSSIDTEAPVITPVYGLYTAEDGTQRVRVAFKPENDEQVFPIVTGEENSCDIRSTTYNIFDTDGTTVLGQRIGFFADFANNEDYTFYYKDAYGNASSVSVQIRGIDTEAPSFTSIKWNGTINNMTPDTEGAGPTSRNVTATLKTDKGISSAVLYYYDENAEHHVGAQLSEDDAKKVSLAFSTNLIEITWTDNVADKLILSAKSSTSGLTSYHELPAVTVIDKNGPSVVLNGTPTLAEDKSAKEFRFTVTGAAGEVFTSNLAVTYTVESNGSVVRNAVGAKGNEFIYTARSSAPVTLRFSDDAGNATEYLLTEQMLADVDTASLSVSFNTSASAEGATKNLSELKLQGTTVYVYTSKDARVTLIEDPENDSIETPDPSKVWTVSAKTWTEVTISQSAPIQMLKFDDLNTGKSTYAWLVSDVDRVAPAISYTGEDTVFADTEMTPAEIQTLMLADVSAYDAVDGGIDHATITAAGISTVPGLHIVTYTAKDKAGNTATLERNLYVKGKYDPIVRVNGKDTIPLGTISLATRTISVTASCALAGDNHVYLAIRPGIMTAARMKYASVTGKDSLSFTAPKDGFYTVLARNRDRTEVITYIYVETGN